MPTLELDIAVLAGPCESYSPVGNEPDRGVECIEAGVWCERCKRVICPTCHRASSCEVAA